MYGTPESFRNMGHCFSLLLCFVCPRPNLDGSVNSESSAGKIFSRSYENSFFQYIFFLAVQGPFLSIHRNYSVDI